MQRPSATLMKKWNEKLKNSGFRDIETQGTTPLPKDWHAFKWRRVTAAEMAERQDYFIRATHMLESFTFHSDTERRIWQMYCDGLSIRQIAAKLRSHKREFVRTTICVLQTFIEGRP